MIRTDLCSLLGITHPLVQAGMARYGTNADLTAAVSDAGGLGVLGCLGRPAGEARGEIRRIRERTDRPFGVNHVLQHLDEESFAACLAEYVPVFCFFRGDPTEATARAHDAGAVVLHQVTTVEEARQAVAAGVDGLIAQGTEAGGHMGPVPLFALLPDVLHVAEGRPVLAAGGIVDGRGLAAVLCLGASGAVVGTRFLATNESPASRAHKAAILAAGPGNTVASGVFDDIVGQQWPGVQARAIRNRLTDRWVGRDAELPPVRREVQARLQAAEARDDADEIVLLAGAGVGRIHSMEAAGDLVKQIVAEASAILRQASTQIGT